jgi:predicted patatin/cPLA2 family phospholipase
MKKTGLILEGGATRGVFTSGALDYLMEQNLYFPYVIGVSAGSCNAVDYVSKQIGRTRDCMIHKEKEYSYINMRNVIKNRSLFDMDMIFDKYPNEIFPFDYDTFFASDIKCEIVATNCLTGKAEYFEEKSKKERLMAICRASSSMPVVAPAVKIDGVPYLDGGLADSIPIRHALKAGYKKNVVILTRNPGYRKKEKKKLNQIYIAAYRKYPELLRAIYRRAYEYNRTLDLIDRLEREGRIFVVRPQAKTVSRAERNYDTLMNFYQHGYDHMKERYGEMLEYLDK